MLMRVADASVQVSKGTEALLQAEMRAGTVDLEALDDVKSIQVMMANIDLLCLHSHLGHGMATVQSHAWHGP